MPLEIRILSGTRAGQTARFEQSTIVVGRLDGSDLKFDPQQDLDVSSKHAEIRVVAGGGYEVHDNNSTNGTLVNGARITGSARLKNGDRVKFGREGPEVEVLFRATSGVKVGSTEERVAVAVRQQTAGLRRLLLAGLGIVVVGLAAAYWIGQRAASQEVERLRVQLAQNDARIKAIQNGMPGDTTLANELQRQLTSLDNRLKGATSEAERKKLSGEMEEIQNKLSGLSRMDLPSINARNAPAVAILVSKINGKAFAGTAFAITSDGVLLTNRHNVLSEDGRDTTTDIAIKFRNSGAWRQAKLVRISANPDVDLALIRMVDPDTYPTVAAFQSTDDNAHEGASVATIGFPLGYETAQEGEGNDFIAKTTLNGGTVSKRTTTVLQIDSFAGHGSSGSPVFTSTGKVVGVVWGGPPGAGGRIVYAVPPDKIAAFLGPEYRALIRD